MKHIRIFETEQQRTSVLNSATYSILHKLAGQNGITLTIKDGPGPEPTPTNSVILKFVTTEPNQEGVMLIGQDNDNPAYNGECFAYMVKDGVRIDERFWTEYIYFEEAGEHTVELVFVNDFDGNLPDMCFYSCSCTEAILGSSVTSIGGGAFSSCSGLTSVTIPSNVTSIGESAFHSCDSMASITIPSNVTIIESQAFNGCTSLTSITIPSSVTTIKTQAFDSCSGLTSVTIPNSVTDIESYAFRWCTGLTSVTIGNSVEYIGKEAFYYCTHLTSITCLSETPAEFYEYDNHNTFGSTNNCPIYVPAASVDLYKAASGWSEYASRIQAIQ